ncbi:PFGI-1 class ICE element type IV pilus protein PilL2 [Pseudomonas huaxiensis]|uniref:PFGI-1 class ICE element type IV pilus protein PilL2 n=1 Tax=Pseudomonas huaxiensis TaxID=2213017 RepID=UPI000DA670B1
MNHLPCSCAYLTGVFLITLISGCATFVSSHEEETTATGQQCAQPSEAVVLQGRYRRARPGPTADQTNLLLQIIELDIPTPPVESVGSALKYLLLKSGFQLCNTSIELNQLLDLPVPAVHLKLGPMALRDALETLSGPAWSLEVDQSQRRICFSKRDPLMNRPVTGEQP